MTNQHREQGSSQEALQGAAMHTDSPGLAPVSSQHQELVETIRAGLTSSEPMMAARREGRVALDSLVEQLETLRRHDEAATQDAVFFRKGLVDAQEQLERLRTALERIALEGMNNSKEDIIGVAVDALSRGVSIQPKSLNLSDDLGGF